MFCEPTLIFKAMRLDKMMGLVWGREEHERGNIGTGQLGFWTQPKRGRPGATTWSGTVRLCRRPHRLPSLHWKQDVPSYL